MTCGTCYASEGHVAGCPEEGPPLPLGVEMNLGVEAPMHPEERARFARELKERLNTHRTSFAVSKFMFEVQDENEVPNGSSRLIDGTERPDIQGIKVVSPACLRLLLDYCEHPEWEMGFVEYCAAIFHGRTPAVGECAFDLLPDVRKKLSADRLGFGHIYGGSNGT